MKGCGLDSEFGLVRGPTNLAGSMYLEWFGGNSLPSRPSTSLSASAALDISDGGGFPRVLIQVAGNQTDSKLILTPSLLLEVEVLKGKLIVLHGQQDG